MATVEWPTVTPTERTPELTAVLWDMDGTLVDTEPYWIEAEIALVHAHNQPWDESLAMNLVGRGLWDNAEILRSLGVRLDADEIVHRLSGEVTSKLHTQGIPWRPGAQELLAQLREAHIPTALVTMSLTAMAERVVQAIPFPAFDLIVGGDAVQHAKPHPEPYLTAADRLGVPITACVAIEDSVPGVTSAATAGAAAIGVPYLVSLDTAPARTLWPTLVGRTVADLRDVLALAPTEGAA